MDKRNWLRNWNRFKGTEHQRSFDFFDFLALIDSAENLEQLEDLKKVFLTNLKVRKENIIKRDNERKLV